MKLLLFLAVVVAAGIVSTLIAIQQQPVEIVTTVTETAPREEIRSEPITSGDKAHLITEQTMSASQNTTPLAPNAPTGACLALEQRLLEELDDAQQELNRKKNEYADVVETYEDMLDVEERDQQQLDSLRAEKDVAQQAHENAQGEYNGALKRLSKARIECGLFS